MFVVISFNWYTCCSIRVYISCFFLNLIEISSSVLDLFIISISFQSFQIWVKVHYTSFLSVGTSYFFTTLHMLFISCCLANIWISYFWFILSQITFYDVISIPHNRMIWYANLMNRTWPVKVEIWMYVSNTLSSIFLMFHFFSAAFILRIRSLDHYYWLHFKWERICCFFTICKLIWKKIVQNTMN